MIRLPRACRGRTAVRFPANSSHMCCLELALDRQLCTHLGSKRFLRRGFPPFSNPTALSRWWTHIRAKQLSLLRARYGCGFVYVFHLLEICTIFNAIESSSIYFSSITIFHVISKQIQRRARIGKSFAR